jgi:hypothetical protein
MNLHPSGKITHNLAFIVGAVPILILLGLIYRYAVNIPFWDQWDIIYIFENFDSGTLSFNDFWKQHNEHRLVFPNLIFLGAGLLTDYNVIFEMYFSVLIVMITSLVCIRHLQKNKETIQNHWIDTNLWVPIPFFLFSLAQWENWLWGFQIQWFLNILFIIVGAFVISNYEINRYSVTVLAIAGILSTFTLSNGILFWPVIWLVLIIRAFKTPWFRSWRTIAIWALLSFLIVGLYLYGYKKPGGHPSVLAFLDDPIAFIGYVPAYIGAPLSINRTIMILMGALGICLYSYISLRLIIKESAVNLKVNLFFITIGLYSLSCAILTAVGRSGFGMWQATASRYTTVSLVFWLSLFFLLLVPGTEQIGLFPKSWKKARLLGYAVSCVIFLMICIHSVGSIKYYKQTHESRYCGQQAVLFGTDLNCLGNLYPNPERLKNIDIPRLQKLQLSVFKTNP